MFSNTMLALAVALVLYGGQRLCRSSVANARGTAPPPWPRWQRVLIQPHLIGGAGERSAPEADALQARQHRLRDDIARSPLDAISRRRLMGELDAWRQDESGDQAALSLIRERFEHETDRVSDAPSDDASQESIQTLRSALTGRESELQTLRQRLDAMQVPAVILADMDGVADPFDRVPGKDDLRAIQGIGKRMQRLLNSMGVTTFAQLAAFERSHIERVAAELDGSRDDIEAENWVGQARELLARRRRTHEEG